MTIDVAKLNYGIVVGPDAGVTTAKLNYSAVVGPSAGITVTKLSYAVIVDTTTPEVALGRRRMMMVS